MDEDFLEAIHACDSKLKLPSLSQVHGFIDAMIDCLFPVRTGYTPPREGCVKVCWTHLRTSLIEMMLPVMGGDRTKAEKLAADFFARIPVTYGNLQAEASTFCKFDPAARSVDEVVMCYPGFYAITIYRISNILFTLGVPVLPRIISEHAHSKTGIDIHPGAKIGTEFFIDHGTGVVIGETTLIGNRVKIYQGVTLGALYVEKSLQGAKRHPTIEDDVIIYSGSTILGGDTVVGHDSVIGGNVWLTESVAPYSVVSHRPEISIRSKCDIKKKEK